jgi:RNA polymerase sigma factor (TIGR02999 family)
MPPPPRLAWSVVAEYPPAVPPSLAELYPEVYELLRAVAAKRLRGGPAAVDPTSLVHEAWLKLDAGNAAVGGREHLRAVAAMAIRQILVDRLRRAGAARRGGGAEAVQLTTIPALDGKDVDSLALEEALSALEAVDERAANGVVMRFYGGMTAPEIAVAQGTSVSTVEADWRRARAFLASRLR